MQTGFVMLIGVSLLCSATAQSAFTVRAVRNGNPVNDRERVDLLAFNDGIGGTGTKLQAVSFAYSTSFGTKVYFATSDSLPVDDDNNPLPDGIMDSVTLYNSGPGSVPNTSQLRLATAPGVTPFQSPAAGDHTYQGFNPSVFPNNVTGTPYRNPLTAFQGAYGVLGSTAPTANVGAGATFGRLFVDAGGSFTLTGRIGGDQGAAVSFSVIYPGDIVDPEPLVVVSPPPQTVTFGKNVMGGVSFSAIVIATASNAADMLSLMVGTLPAGVSNIVVTGGGPSPAFFTVTGRLAYSTNKTTVTIPVTVTDSLYGQASVASIVLNVVPEPTTPLVGVTFFAVSRRRRI